MIARQQKFVGYLERYSAAAKREMEASKQAANSGKMVMSAPKMNVAIHGLNANLATRWGDTFARDQHPELEADFVMANPPFNVDEVDADKVLPAIGTFASVTIPTAGRVLPSLRVYVGMGVVVMSPLFQIRGATARRR